MLPLHEGLDTWAGLPGRLADFVTTDTTVRGPGPIALVQPAAPAVPGEFPVGVVARCLDDCIRIISAIKSINSGEASYIQQLGIEVMKSNTPHRVTLHTMSRGDIIEYLPVRDVVRNAPDGASWESLRSAVPTGKDFKKWLQGFGARFGDDTLRRAVSRLEALDPDLVEVLDLVAVLAGRRRQDLLVDWVASGGDRSDAHIRKVV